MIQVRSAAVHVDGVRRTSSAGRSHSHAQSYSELVQSGREQPPLVPLPAGCISGALPYIRDDILLPRFAGQPAALAHWQELIVSAAIVAVC